MADGFIVRKGGVAVEQTATPSILDFSTASGTSIKFKLTNNDSVAATLVYRFGTLTGDGESISVAANTTTSEITLTGLTLPNTLFVTANATGKVKSEVAEQEFKQIPAPTITLVSKTDTSVTFTLKNNSVETRDVTFGLTTPPTTTTISLASDATSGNQTFSNLDSDTFITIFAQAEGGLIGQLNVTTDETLVFTAATGGTTLEYDDGGKRFRSHTFISNGTFEVTTVGDEEDDRNKVDYLIIAGGGGGASSRSTSSYASGSAGGAGGYRTTLGTSGANSSARDKVTVTATSFGVTIGVGGTGGADQTNGGTNGTASSVAFGTTISTTGGGAGRSYRDSTITGNNGGSGGGGSSASSGSSTGGLGTAFEGNNGGNGGAPSAYGTGGGGGAGQVGSNGTNNAAGNGGNGLPNLLRTGSNETRAGGGGGTTYQARGPVGTGGLGGGGNGANSSATVGVNGGNATANTGSGGGGASSASSATHAVGGNGANGIVVIRYEIAPTV